jgi:hypothetical protein
MKKLFTISLVSLVALTLSAKEWSEIYAEYTASVNSGVSVYKTCLNLYAAYPEEAKALFNEVKDLDTSKYDLIADAEAEKQWNALTADQKKEASAKKHIAIRHVVVKQAYDEAIEFSIQMTPTNVAKAKPLSWYNALKAAGFKSNGRTLPVINCLRISFCYGDYDYVLAQDPKRFGPWGWEVFVDACKETTNYDVALKVLSNIKKLALDRGLENHNIYAKATAAQKFVLNEKLINSLSK